MKSSTSKINLSDHHRLIIVVLTLTESRVAGRSSGISEDMFTLDRLKKKN